MTIVSRPAVKWVSRFSAGRTCYNFVTTNQRQLFSSDRTPTGLDEQ